MKIKLRRYELEYAKEHCAAVKASIECLKKWFTWASPDYCLCDTIKFIEGQSNRRNEGKYDYAIIDIDDNEFLGSCGLAKVKTHNNEQIASMSYWRRQDTKISHVMKEAWEEVESEAFKLGIKRIEIDVAHCNEPSKKVAAEHFGAKSERDIPIRGGDGKIHDGRRYVIDCPTKK